MKKLLGWIVLVAAVGGAAFYGYGVHTQLERQKAYDDTLAAAKREFLQQSVGLRLLDSDQYRREIGVALTRYHSKIAKLGKDYPEFFDLERERKKSAELLAENHLTPEKKSAMDERIDFTLDLFNRMRSGQYRPLHTVADKAFRFDIYDISPVEGSRGQRVRVSYVHWGAFGPVEYKGILGNIRTEQKAGKPIEIPQLVAENAPPNLQIDPERWVLEFLPGVEIGYYDFPLFPHEATAVALSFDFSIRTLGGTPLDLHLSFGEIPIPESWRLPEGEAWAAQERLVVDQEQLRAAGGQ